MRHANKILGIGIALVLVTALGFPPVWNRFFVLAMGLWLSGMAVCSRWPVKAVFKMKGVKKERLPETSAAEVSGGNAASLYASNDNPTSNTHGKNQTP